MADKGKKIVNQWGILNKWNYKWPMNEDGKCKSVRDFSDIEKVKYQIFMARLECTVDGIRHINEELLYLTNWYAYFDLLAKAGEFDPQCVQYLHLELVRLYKERTGWH